MPGYGIPGLPFAALAPLVALALGSEGARDAAFRGFLAGTAANFLLFYWIAYTVAVPGKLGWAPGILAALLVSAYVAVYVSAACWAAFRLAARFGESGLWAFPFAWVGLEYARSVLFTGFPWLILGYGLSESPALRQAADMAGVPGLGFLLAVSGVALHRTGTLMARRSWRACAAPAAVFIAVPSFLFAYGSWRNAAADRLPAARTLRVAVAQGGIDQSLKWNPEFQAGTVAVYRSLSGEAAAAGAEVIVWPETAAPFFYGWEAELSGEIDRIAADAGIPLVFGAPWFDPSGGGKYFNSVFLLDGRGVPRGRYDKRHLVPFGEYIPLRPVLFFLKKLTAGEGDFSAGTGPALFRVDGGDAGASVCYEALFPGIIRDGVRGGAAWLVNVTNDAWFGDTVAPRQHLAMARMRSVEFRRPMVRAANAGISAVIDATGASVAELGLFRRGIVAGAVRPGSGETLYAKSGAIFEISCAILAFLITFVPLRGTDGHWTAGGKSRRP
jgi:apolipoprotein N-acyltransferase